MQIEVDVNQREQTPPINEKHWLVFEYVNISPRGRFLQLFYKSNYLFTNKIDIAGKLYTRGIRGRNRWYLGDPGR